MKQTLLATFLLFAASASVSQAAVFTENVMPASAAAIGATAAEPQDSIALSVKAFMDVRGSVGEKSVAGTVRVEAYGLTEPARIEPSGAANGIFTTDVTVLPAGTSVTDVTVYYEPKKLGKNKGSLYFVVGENYVEEIRLAGIAIDPATPPALEITPAEGFSFPTVKVGQSVSDTILVTPAGMPDYIKVAVQNDSEGFSVNSSLLVPSVPQKVIVTFTPKAAGNYTGTLTIGNEFVTPVVLNLKAKAIDEGGEEEREGDSLPLDGSLPQALVEEDFAAIAHNKPLKLEGWKNLAVKGTRAWWGYAFPEYDTENAGEVTAKVTAYDGKMPVGEETPVEMLLVTPALNFTDAATKLFTFRVMGQNLTDNMSDSLQLCYIYLDPATDAAVVEPIQNVGIPASKEAAGEWVELHIDLTGQNIEPTFFMGFRYIGTRGRTSSTVYYIDDVSFGRTDIPLITPSETEVLIEAAPGQPTVSPVVEIKTQHLAEDIKLTLGGGDKGKFELSLPTLPKEGGPIAVKYNGDEGQYGCYVKLDSRGAATKYVYFFSVCLTGINTLSLTPAESVLIYDLNGRLAASATGSSLSEKLDALPRGTYVIKSRQQTLKVQAGGKTGR